MSDPAIDLEQPHVVIGYRLKERRVKIVTLYRHEDGRWQYTHHWDDLAPEEFNLLITDLTDEGYTHIPMEDLTPGQPTEHKALPFALLFKGVAMDAAGAAFYNTHNVLVRNGERAKWDVL